MANQGQSVKRPLWKQFLLLCVRLAGFWMLLLLLGRFTLMVFYPGTEATLGLFTMLLPVWDLFMGLTNLLLLPLTVLSQVFSPFLPSNIQAWFPVAPAAAFLHDASEALGVGSSKIDYNTTYPGKLEWLCLLAIPLWSFLLLIVDIGLQILPDFYEAGGGETGGKVSKKSRHAYHQSGHQSSYQSGQGHAQISSRSNAPPKAFGLSKTRLNEPPPKRQKPAPPVNTPPANQPPRGKNTFQDFKDKEGALGIRQMMQDLKSENASLQSKQQELRSTFSQYFSPKVLKYMEENQIDFQTMTNEKKDVTVLFCDIRGFTSFSQNHSPERIREYLSEYFTVANDVILNRHDGVINKLMGDGIMAYWGFPLPNPNHHLVATQAALDIIKEVEFRNSCLPEGKPKLEVGIGLCSGEVMVGNIGSDDFKDFTLLGNPVNLASRLDGINKTLNTKILISESTYQGLQGRLPCRDHGIINIRGWEGDFSVYEPIG